MANITKEQVEKIESKLHNNWKFNLTYFYFNSGEKTLFKDIELDENRFIRAGLWFTETYTNYRPDGWKITLHIALYTGTHSGMYSSSGMGLFREIPYEKSRRCFADLEKLTAVIDDAYIMDIYSSGNNAQKCLDNVLLDKSGWHIHEV